MLPVGVVVAALMSAPLSTLTVDDCWNPPPGPGPCRQLTDGYILAALACAVCLLQLLQDLPTDWIQDAPLEWKVAE